MIVLDLCNRFCPDKIPVKTAECLGDGADGELFAILNEPNKVIKFSVIYDRFSKSPKTIYKKNILPVLKYIVDNQPSICANIFEHGYLGEYSRPMPYWKDGIQSFVLHYCIMERLLSLSEDENKVFHSIISHEDREIKKDFSLEEVFVILQGLTRGLDFDLEKIMAFCKQLRLSKINHNDLHPRNIMKNKNGQFKIIDFDRTILEE